VILFNSLLLSFGGSLSALFLFSWAWSLVVKIPTRAMPEMIKISPVRNIEISHLIVFSFPLRSVGMRKAKTEYILCTLESSFYLPNIIE
jgi:hypothetical protein